MTPASTPATHVKWLTRLLVPVTVALLAACSAGDPAEAPEADAGAAPEATTEAPALVNEPFTESRFQALQAAGALVLVDVSASWCPTCREQKRVLARFQQQHPEVALTILNVDYDDQKQWVRHFKAPRQSTLALYRGDEQLWFAVAEVREDVIFEALRQGAAGAAGA